MNESPDILYRNSQRSVQQVSMKFQRELLHSINWNARIIGIKGPKGRIIGIKGPKGVGKSTLLKQRIKEAFHDESKVLYVSLDNMWFANNTLADLVEYPWRQ